jgi:hypothetical protein
VLDVGQEVRVELPNGHKFVGTVVRQSGLDYFVEDTRGFERVVRPHRDGVTVVDIEEERRSRGRSL